MQQLKLQSDNANSRNNVPALWRDMRDAGVVGALMLPTASAASVHRTNQRHIAISSRTDFLATAGTLHPDDPEMTKEIAFLQDHRVRVIKLCSFSQGFTLDGPAARAMFDALQAANRNTRRPLAVILDTLYRADRHFGTRSAFNTHPRLLAELADRYPSIRFIGAHMGGLDAPFDEIRTHLYPRPNLFLDTSNAAHILTASQFCDLAVIHGPHHILFGTDWPWFVPADEIEIIDGLLDRAGFSGKDKHRVFYQNAVDLVRNACDENLPIDVPVPSALRNRPQSS